MTKNDILDAAFTVWGRELYKTTSLTKLAQRLGVSKPALYRHFPGKKTLLTAMNARFYSDYDRELKPVMEEALKTPLWREQFLFVARFHIAYFMRNFDYFIYALFDIHNRKDHMVDKKYKNPLTDLYGAADENGARYPSALFLTVITALFETARFHKKRRNGCAADAGHAPRAAARPPDESELRSFVDGAAERIRHGLGFTRERVNGIPFERLEHAAAGLLARGADEHRLTVPLFKKIAEAIAEAGPWNASMETVAKRSGYSKSGLYAHFKNKLDMLSRLFMTEFKRISEIAAACSALSEGREERLYLAVFSVTEYLKARPEILTALDWVRIQRLELDLSIPASMLDVFAGLDLIDSKTASKWVLFLVVTVLMHHGELSGTGLRKMFRFIMLGIEGM